MARFNIHVPDSLKAQMDELKGCNWSAVAQEAFARNITREARKVRIDLGRNTDEDRFFGMAGLDRPD